MVKKVCIDTNIFGWYLKGEATVGQEANVTKARALFNKLEEEKVVVFIPSIVVAEILNGMETQEERDELASYISENFDVGSFDIVCAIEYAKLFKSLEKNALDVYRNAENVPKWKMKQDWMIAVEAKISGCSQLLTNNKSDFQNFVGDYIEILDLDEAVKGLTKMESLFEDEQIIKK